MSIFRTIRNKILKEVFDVNEYVLDLRGLETYLFRNLLLNMKEDIVSILEKKPNSNVVSSITSFFKLKNINEYFSNLSIDQTLDYFIKSENLPANMSSEILKFISQP